MSKTIETQVEKSRMLIDGFRKNIGELAAKGVTAEKLNKMEADLKRLEDAGKNVEEIRGTLSAATKQMNAILDEVKNDFQSEKKIIKADYPQEKWIKYGVADKR